jgi:GTP pyrophosphokinase
VVTQKAKAKIKDLLKEAKRKLAEEGKEVLQRKMKQLKMDTGSQAFETMRTFFNVNSQLDLHYEVATGRIGLAELKRFKEHKPETPRPKATEEPRRDGDQSVRKLHEDILLIGEDMDVVEYKLAKCCTPIPGDEVFGFVTMNEGIKIHRTNCTNAPELLSNHGHRVIKAKWTSQHEVAFLTGLKVVGTDRVGLINDVSKIISEELKVNMSSIAFRSNQGIFDGEIMLYVNDTRHLDLLIKKLEKVEGVVKVSRFDSATVGRTQ